MRHADGEATGLQREEQGRQPRAIPESIIIVCRMCGSAVFCALCSRMFIIPNSSSSASNNFTPGGEEGEICGLSLGDLSAC
jgi:hypothetical protein